MTKKINAVNAKLPTDVSLHGEIEDDVHISVDVDTSIPNIQQKKENTDTNLSVSKVFPSTDNAHSRIEPNVSNSDLMEMLLSQNRLFMLQKELDAKEREADREVMKNMVEKINLIVDQKVKYEIEKERTRKKRRLSNNGDSSSSTSQCCSETTLVIQDDEPLTSNEEFVRSINKRTPD